METPRQVHASASTSKTPNVLFPQNLAEPVAVIFAREVLEEDGDLKKRLIGTGPYMLKEHTRKVQGRAGAQPRLLRQGPPVRRRVRHPVHAGRRDPHGRVPHRPERLPLAGEPVRGRDAPQDQPERHVQSYHNTLAPCWAWRSPRTGRPSTTCGCGARSRWPSTGRSRWTRSTRATASSAGACRTSTTRTRRPPLPSSARTGSTSRPRRRSCWPRPGHPNGFETTLFYYEYFPQMTSQVQLVQQDLKKNLNIDVKITKLDYTTFYGRYVEGKWDGMCLGLQVGPRGGPRRADPPVHALEVQRRTSSACNDAVVDELVPSSGRRRTAPSSARITKKIVDREVDQVLRMWMPYDNGFLMCQPHLRNVGRPGAPAQRRLRRVDARPALAR